MGVANVRAAGFARRSDVVKVFVLVVFDVFALYEAFIAAYAVRASAPRPFAHYISQTGFELLSIAVAPIWVLFFALCGLYSSRLEHRRVSEATRVFVAVCCGVMVLIVSDYLRTRDPLFPSRSIPVWAALFGVVFVLLCRAFVRFMMRQAFARGMGLHTVILIGRGDLAERIASDLSRPGQGYRIVGVVDPSCDGGVTESGTPVFPTLASAIDAQPLRVDEVVQADVTLDRSEIAAMMAHANARGVAYRFVPDQYGIYAAASTMSTVAGVPVMEVRLTALDGWGAIGKRAFDLVGSLLLLIVLSPVMLVLAALVKLTDPAGPVFYTQQRLGKNGRVIGVRKFRSMRWEYSTGPDRPYKTAEEAFVAMGRPDLCAEFVINHKVADDPRVSTIGRFLRQSSLDELPQLINALTGELSLVGPRPITTAELERYGSQRASFLALKPGITGLWQVSGRSDIAYSERVKLDVFYVENWSVGLDMSILLKTVRTVTARRGAV